MIYHVTTIKEWEFAKKQGFYEAPSLHTEGFIHTSKQEQVAGVLQRYYQGKNDLLILHINEALLTAPLKEELAISVNETFPHIYGRLNINAVVKTELI